MFRGSERHGPWVVSCLAGVWAELLGSRIAAACAPVRWERGRLWIEVRDPTWATTLESMRAELLGRIRERTDGEVAELEFWLTRP